MVMVDVESNESSSPARMEGAVGGGEVRESIFQRPQRTVTLKFEDVVYKIKTRVKTQDENGKLKTKITDRTILNKVSGVILPGEMLAMMGPSGSGKTTILTALCARLSGKLSGSITYNDRPFTTATKRNMGFVTQDDVLYPHLTVNETLLYTAYLRLPQSLTRAEKAIKSDAVITSLGLVSCSDSIVGGPLIRGVSGGERKRVSIGQEMLINPSLMFLDEPTSGLDSTTAQRIVSVLSEMAKSGRTVIMTIHQPSSRVFYMFDKLLLVSDGNPVYFGKRSEVMGYFDSIGYAPSVAMNPSDFLLDLANGISSYDSQNLSQASVKQSLFSGYSSNIQLELKMEIAATCVNATEEEIGNETNHWNTAWFEQFRVLLQRGLKERRHEAFSTIKMIQITVTTLLAGFLWLHSSSRVQDQIGLLFFMTGFWAFFPIFEAIFTFPQERSMLQKERSSGMYRLSSYFVARTVSDLPMELILPILSITVMYWMGGLNPSAASFFITIAILLLGVLVAQGLGLAIGALMMNLKTATTLSNVIMLSFMLVGGFFVQKVPVFMAWIKYISLIYHTFRLVVITQFSDHNGLKDIPTVKAVGLGKADFSFMALIIMLFVYRLVAYLALMRIGIVSQRNNNKLTKETY